MIARNRGILLSLVAIVALAAVSVSASLSQEPSYSPDGAWFATGDMGGGMALPFMDIYTSNPTTQGRSGTVLCTLSAPAFPTPYGKLNATTTGHGNWTRVSKNEFAFTVYRIMVDAEPTRMPGAPMGTIKFWGTITVTGPDAFVGTMNAEYYGPDGQSFLTIKGIATAGKRIAVEIEEPEEGRADRVQARDR
jgi:hypothetical protein